MKATLSLALALLLELVVVDRGEARPGPIMVFSGKLTPIMPALPTPPPPVPYPPVPPAPVWEDPEPGYNNAISYSTGPSSASKYGFRIKPLKNYGTVIQRHTRKYLLQGGAGFMLPY